MDYQQAIQYASKQKEIIDNLDALIDQLWAEGKTVLITGHGEKFVAVFTRKGLLFDVILTSSAENVGYIAIKTEGSGVYSIVNDSSINPHPTFDRTGHGLEVQKKYRKRGIGAALLTLGIGLVQRDCKEKGDVRSFKVLATDVTKLGLGCYHNFGFQIKEGLQVTAGCYTDPDHVPAIKILRKKASRLSSLKKRLGFGS